MCHLNLFLLSHSLCKTGHVRLGWGRMVWWAGSGRMVSSYWQLVASSKAFSCQSCYCCSLFVPFLFLTSSSLHLPQVLTFLLLVLLNAYFACVLGWISALGAFLWPQSVAPSSTRVFVYIFKIYIIFYMHVYVFMTYGTVWWLKLCELL